MSCPGEQTWIVYVDGELAPDEIRSVEAHLVTCQRCRTRVMALREEGTLIAEALKEPDVRHPLAQPVDAPARGLALGVPISIAVATAALAGAGLLLEARLPGGLSLLNPLRLMGAYEMVFDVVFLARDRVPGLLEFVVSVAAVGSVSALGSFVVSALVRRVAGPAALLLALPLVLASEPGSALETRFDQDTHVAKGETIHDTLVASGDLVRVDGVVDGDLIAAAERIRVSGRVTGSLFAFGREVEVSGTVGEGIHAIAERVRVDGSVGTNAYSLAEGFTLDSEGALGRDAILLGEHAVIDGSVARDVVFGGHWIEVRGGLERNLEVLGAERVALIGGARIGGDVEAALPEGTEIELEAGAQVMGETRTRPRVHRAASHYREFHFYAWFAIQFAASFVFGLLIYALAPSLFDAVIPTAGAFLRSLGWGFVFLVATPLALIAVALTIVGIPVAVLGLFAYLTALYVADIAVGALIGRAILRPEPGLAPFGRALLLGLAIVVIGHLVPYLGAAVALVSLLLGLGLLTDRARSLWLLRA